MDVDLLRTGTVPMAPDTILWFEFLLDQDLLLKHLEKPNPDPSPIELIAKFSDAVVDTLRIRMEPENGTDAIIIEPNMDNSKQPAKNICLKILSLKVAAFLKWNLAEIRSLPFKTQVNLLQDLLYFTNNNEMVQVPNVDFREENAETVSSAHLFALLVYHRWLLSVTMHRITSNFTNRFGNTEINPLEENIICSPENVKKTIDFLTSALEWTKVPGMITFDSLKPPTDKTDVEFNWDDCKAICKDELNSQINYDLGTFYFYKENYDLAKEHFLKCKNNYRNLPKDKIVGFATFNLYTLDVNVRTCCGPTNKETVGLMEQLNSSIVNHFKGITTILQQDNIYKEIPLNYRITLELDVQGAVSSGTFTVARDLLFKIRALNIVRCVLDRKAVYHCSTDLFLKNQAETLIWAIQITWKSFSITDKESLKKFLLESVLRKESHNLLKIIQTNEILSNLFEKFELELIKETHFPIEVADTLKIDCPIYDFTKKRKPKLELKQLEQQLISSYNHKAIRDLLNKLTANQSSNNIFQMNPKWELSIPLQSVLKSLPKGFQQDFAFILLAKAKELLLNKNWTCCLELLVILDKELSTDLNNPNVVKLIRLISWEILLVQMTQLLEEWPNSTIDKAALANACEACLQANESVVARTEIMEHCVICLLNLGRWEFLLNFDNRWQSYEIAPALALACQELIKHKGGKKLSKNLWDLILPMFTFNQTKKSGSSSVFMESPAVNLKNGVLRTFSKLRDATVLTVVISMLTRLNNVLKDESSLELQVDYAILWPAVVSNANSYSIKIANEILSQVVTQALHYHPNNVPWLRLMGDINFANGYYNSSLSFYLKSLLIFHDYFNIPVSFDDHIFRRMIKCCTALQCHTQAAVLCQFLDEPDYVLAFRILGEQKLCNDAVDAYYHCFWDVNILEYLIHMHHKKGEFQRRKSAIQVIGLLELNSNNNKEIQREAINLRKSMFLRALCKQYVF